MSGEQLAAGAPAFVDPADVHAVIQAVLSIVIDAWKEVRQASQLTEEHRRDERKPAGLLCQRMKCVERKRKPRKPAMKIRPEASTFSSDTLEVPDGRIDIEIIYSLSDEPDLRLECKKISTTQRDDPTALARYYVNGGVLRFVGQKYGSGQRWGIMVAFATDGDVSSAVALVSRYVASYKNSPKHLSRDWRQERRFGAASDVYSTEHLQNGGPGRIELLHLFLPFPPRDQ